MQSNNSSIALLVPSCDKYIDVIDQFFDRQERYMGWWKYNRYVLIEEASYHRAGVTTLYSSHGEAWADRLRRNVETMNEEYFLFLLDDYFLSQYVSEIEIHNAIEIMKKEGIKYYKLVNNPRVNYQYASYKHLSRIPNNIRYGINLAECIVRKDFLLEILARGMNIWEVESSFLSYVNDKFTGFIDDCVSDTRNLLKTRYAIMKGKWVLPTVWFFKRKGMPIVVGNRKLSGPLILCKVKIDIFLNRHLKTKTIRALKKILGFFGFKFVSKK